MKAFQFQFTDVTKEYHYAFEVGVTLDVVQQLLDKVDRPFVWQVGTLSNDFFDVRYGQEIDLKIAVDKVANKISGEENFWRSLDIIAVKDEEWTKERNKDYRFEAYIKYALKDECVIKFREIFETWKSELLVIQKEMRQEQKSERQAKEARRQAYTVVTEHAKVLPHGGEGGVDGYYDVTLEDEDGERVRVVTRDVFDFGIYTYPKSVEGSDEVFKRETWSEAERKACEWLNEFSPFADNVIRM